MQKGIYLLLFFLLATSGISGQDTVRFFVLPAYAETGTILTLPVHVNNFEDVDGYQFSMKWDTSKLAFDSILDFGLPQLSFGNFGVGETSSGSLAASWSGSTASGESLPDSAIIFSIRFKPKGDCSDVSSFLFTDNPLESFVFRFDGVDIIELPAVYHGSNIMNYCTLQVDTVQIINNGCQGDTSGSILVIASGGMPPYEIVWNTGQLEFMIDSLVMGYYGFILTDGIGNQLVYDSIFVNEGASFTFDLGNDTTLCDTSGYLIELTNQNDISTTAWFINEANLGVDGALEYLALQSGLYSVTAYGPAGCFARDSIRVSIYDGIELTVEAEKMTICLGDSIPIIASGGENYLWITGNESLSSDTMAMPTVFPIEPTTYTVIASNACFSDTAAIQIDVSTMIATAGNDTCIALGAKVQLHASGGENYEWLPSEYPLSSTVISNPTAQPEDSTLFFVIITDQHGCTILDTVSVAVASDSLHTMLRVNVITPNGDGRNDLLIFSNLGKYPNNTLSVFNRWGNLVYSAISYDNDWDGTHNGKPLPAGVYYYVLSFAGRGVIKSSLTILRE